MSGKGKPPETPSESSNESGTRVTKLVGAAAGPSIDERDELDRGARTLDSDKEELKAEKKNLETKLDALEEARDLLVRFGTGQATAADLNTKVKTYPLWTDSAVDEGRIAARLTALDEEKKAVNEQLTAVQKQLANLSAPERRQMKLTDFDFKSPQFMERLTTPHFVGEFKFATFQSDKWEGNALVQAEAKHCANGSVDKQERSILLIRSGMGSGKSRTLVEVPNIIKSQLPAGSKLFQLNVTFENGTAVRHEEVFPDAQTRTAQAPTAVLVRLVHHLFGGEEVFDEFRKRKFDFNLQAFVETIMTNLGDNAFIVLCVDGVHHLDVDGTTYRDPRINTCGSRDAWYKESALRSILHALHQTMLLRKHIMCAISLTLFRPVEGIIEGSLTVKKIMLTPPTMGSMPPEIANSYVRTHASHFLDIFGEHPRSMETLIDNPGATVSEVLMHSAGELHTRYPDIATLYTEEVTKKVLSYAFSGEGTTADDPVVSGLRLDDVMSIGLLRLKSSKLTVSPALLLIMWRRGSSVLRGWSPSSVDTDSRSFERFVGYVLTIRSRVFAGRVKVSKFLSGTDWLRNRAMNRTVVVKPLELVKAAHQLDTRSERKCGRINGGVGNDVLETCDQEDVAFRKHCVVNGDSAPACVPTPRMWKKASCRAMQTRSK